MGKGWSRTSWTTSKYGTKANMGKRLVARASRTTGNHGTKANTGKGWSQTSWTTRSWLKGQFGQKVVTRVSRTTGNYGTKANYGQKGVARVSRTTGHGSKANLGCCETIADHWSWLEGQFWAKGCPESTRTTGHHGSKADLGKRLVARESLTTGHGTKANMDKR